MFHWTHSLSPLQQRTLDGQGEAETPAKRGKWPPQSGTSLLEQLKVEMRALSKEFKVGCSCLCVCVCVCPASLVLGNTLVYRAIWHFVFEAALLV